MKTIQWPKHFKRLKKGTGRVIEEGSLFKLHEYYNGEAVFLIAKRPFILNHVNPDDMTDTAMFLQEMGIADIVDPDDCPEIDWDEMQLEK